jgi:hypothetical protein
MEVTIVTLAFTVENLQPPASNFPPIYFINIFQASSILLSSNNF